ncbi:MAG: membrane dipeptidase [Nitratireductor sp.]
MISVFDGHNDVLLRLWMAGDLAGESFITGDTGNARKGISTWRAREGGFGGGFFAIFHSARQIGEIFRHRKSEKPKAGSRGRLSRTRSFLCTPGLPASGQRHPVAAGGCRALKIVRKASDIAAARREENLAAIFHMEGADAIGKDLCELDLFPRPGFVRLGLCGAGQPFLRMASRFAFRPRPIPDPASRRQAGVLSSGAMNCGY